MYRFLSRALTGRNPFRFARHRHTWDAERVATLAMLTHVLWVSVYLT